ncbi:MAG: putative FAD-dependent dehydrogenase, partial [Kiritimatiellia bacterium]
MIRISELKLPLAHSEKALRAAIIKRLRIDDSDLTEFTVFKRSFDARKRDNILLVYIVDAATRLS